MFGEREGHGQMDGDTHTHTNRNTRGYVCTLLVAHHGVRTHTYTPAYSHSVSYTLIPCARPETVLNTLPVHTHPVVFTHHYTHTIPHTQRHCHTIPWSRIPTLCMCAHTHTHTQRHKPYSLHIQCLPGLCEVPSALGKGPARVRLFPVGGEEGPGAAIWPKFWFPSALLRGSRGRQTLRPLSLPLLVPPSLPPGAHLASVVREHSEAPMNDSVKTIKSVSRPVGSWVVAQQIKSRPCGHLAS